jgi:hypothetical protein
MRKLENGHHVSQCCAIQLYICKMSIEKPTAAVHIARNNVMAVKSYCCNRFVLQSWLVRIKRAGLWQGRR